MTATVYPYLSEWGWDAAWQKQFDDTQQPNMSPARVIVRLGELYKVTTGQHELLAETTGIFTEAAGGVTVAVLAKLAQEGAIDPAERVVVYVTGEGLKTLDCARGAFTAWRIEPTLASFEHAADHLRAPA